MPTYGYVCAKCGHEFDIFQPMADNPLKTCPKEMCGQKRWGKGRVQRSISGGAGFLFKGSGFYITDYRSDNYKQAAKKDAPAADKTSSKSSDAKPAAKSESKPSKTEST